MDWSCRPLRGPDVGVGNMKFPKVITQGTFEEFIIVGRSTNVTKKMFIGHSSIGICHLTHCKGNLSRCSTLRQKAGKKESKVK